MYSEIGCVIINFLRPDSTIKCVDSLLKQCPNINIYLGDQDSKNIKLKGYYNQSNIKYVELPFDCGISYARNRLVTQALNDGCKYFMWCDNDFIFDTSLNLSHPLIILESNEEIGVVGGSIKKNNVLMHYEKFIYYDKERGILTYVPISITHPEEKIISDIKYYDCDITFNYCLAKKEVWNDDRVRWYEKIKVKYEHSSWFIKLQQYSKYKVVYCPTFSAHHEHVGSNEYNVYRFRSSDEKEFSSHFNLKCMFSIGEKGWDFIKSQMIN